MRLIYGIIPLLLVPIPLNTMINSIETKNINKVLDMDFDSNALLNKVNNKIYTATKETFKYTSSLKGNALEPNGSKITIPFNDLGINDTDEIITISFLMKWAGEDLSQIPISIRTNDNTVNGYYNIWFEDGNIGFNTGLMELYGKQEKLEKGKYYSFIFEFNRTDITKNKLYVDGVKQNLSYVLLNGSVVNSWNKYSTLTIGGASGTDVYNIKDKTIIDEIKVFNKGLTQEEVVKVTKEHEIPTLRSEVIDNSYAKLSWATEMLSEDVLWATSYEETDVRPGLTWADNAWDGEKVFDFYGSQSFSTEDSYTGKYSLRVGDTRYGYNQKWPPITGEKGGVSFSYFKNNIYGIPSGTKLSVSYRAKSETGAKYAFMPIITGNNTLEDYWSVAYENRLKPTVNNGKPVVVMEDFTLSNYGKWVTLNDVSWIPTFDNGQVKDVVLFYDFTGNQKYIKNNMVRISHVNKATSQVFLNPRGDASTLNIKAGTQLQERQTATITSISPAYIDNGGAVFRNDANFHYQTNTDWQLYNFNGVVYSEENCYYNSETEGLYFTIRKATEGVAYIDDIKVGYSTKVRLYRNNNLIYEGYESQFSDTNAIDTTAPTSVSEVNSTMEVVNATTSTRKINIAFKEGMDNGTTYNYQVSAVSKDNGETPLSETNSQTITSGIKGYSYVIDKNATTIPENAVNLTTNKIEQNITDTGVYYLHIKAIDNAGNSSSVVHYKIDILTITANANPSDNNIRLDWTMDDLKYKTFKVYQKKPGSTEFQSISTTNLENGSKTKVLLIYPSKNIPTETFTNWKGETFTLSQSARLKRWMEEPNNESSKGYGMGIIEVDAVSITEFNANPNKYLKDTNGEYKYNVINVGNWNVNNYEDISDIGIVEIRKFIETGRGYLSGHDTSWVYHKNLGSLKDLLNIKYGKFTEGADYTWAVNSPADFDVKVYATGGANVTIKKTGILLNYPWNIGSLNTTLNIPWTHTTGQYVYGDLWMDFTNQGDKLAPDEQKILANTLFYLNQLSNDNFLNDNSGQDITAPNKPVIYGHNFISRGNVEVNFNSVIDNGSTYSYYVESNDNNGHDTTLSNVVTETITSGIKGYSYVVDSNPSTEPDTTIELSSPEAINVDITDNSPKYVHIRAVDNVGNGSETYHYKITETTKPIMNITGNPTSWTNEDVALKITADDLDSGIDYIMLPNGNMVAGENSTYIVTSNGNYTFKAVDKMGNITTQTVVVDKIDKISPTITANKVVSSDKSSANITVSINDNLSGIKYLELPNGTQVTNTTSYNFMTTENGLYPFTVYDNVGNKYTINLEVFELNANIYPSSVARIEYKLSGATVKDWTTYTGAFYITNEGITTITSRSYDKAGNISTEKTSIVKIDKTKPNNNSILIELK